MFHWPAVNSKRLLLYGLTVYWIHLLNKVPLHKVLVLNDLPGNLGIILDKLPTVLIKRFVLDKSPGY